MAGVSGRDSKPLKPDAHPRLGPLPQARTVTYPQHPENRTFECKFTLHDMTTILRRSRISKILNYKTMIYMNFSSACRERWSAGVDVGFRKSEAAAGR